MSAVPAVAFTLDGATRPLAGLDELRAGERVALPLLLEEPEVAAWARRCREAGLEVLLVGRRVVGPCLPPAGGPCFECARRQAALGALPEGLAAAGRGLGTVELSSVLGQALPTTPWPALAGAAVELTSAPRARRWRLARLAGCQDCRRPMPLAEVFYATQLFEIHQAGRA